MKRIVTVVFGLLLFLSGTALSASSGTDLTPDGALKLLMDGNARYVAGQSTHLRQGADRRAETVTGGQHPFATVVGCSDSRESLEILLDQGIGDIFVVRVAGNVAGVDEVGSVEYAVGHLHTPLLLVLGHTACGAVTAAVQNAKVHGSIPALINQIKPAVAKVKRLNPEAKGDDLLNKSIKANVLLVMENVLRKSEEVRELVKAGQLQVVGGIYDLHTGQVSWLGPLPNQCVLLYSEEAKPARDKHSGYEGSAPAAKREAHEPAKTEPESRTGRHRY